ncbi:MAG: WbqC family protein [Burkholderiales bacterium]|nr:WbqC family protein [Burkholderiales bacterium]
MKTVAVMQPYFFPYIGYFQLINAVDQFIVYDNIKYTKKGWINRNRILQHGKEALISLPLKSDSDFLDVVERELAPDFDGGKFLNRLIESYRRAPCFKQVAPVLETVMRFEDRNLFRFIHHSILRVCEYLGIDTEITISSTLSIDHSLKNQEKVIALCKSVRADIYINPIGGTELYAKEEFQTQGIELKFLQALPFEYPQSGNEFVPWLSIVDVMMFNSVESIKERLDSGYQLI